MVARPVVGRTPLMRQGGMGMAAISELERGVKIGGGVAASDKAGSRDV